MALKWYTMLVFILLIAMAIMSLLQIFEDSFKAPLWHDIGVIVLSVIGLVLGATKKKEGGVPTAQ